MVVLLNVRQRRAFVITPLYAICLSTKAQEGMWDIGDKMKYRVLPTYFLPVDLTVIPLIYTKCAFGFGIVIEIAVVIIVYF